MMRHKRNWKIPLTTMISSTIGEDVASILFFRMNNLMDTADVWDDVDEDETQGFEMYTDEGDAAVAEMLRRIQEM